MKINFSEVERIGIVRRNGLGDLLCGMPLIRLCKERCPKAEIVLFVDERGAALVPYLEGLDKIVVIPEGQNKYFSMGKAVWEERRERFDLVISTKTTPMKLMNFFLYALRAKYRVATVDHHWHHRLINCPVPFTPDAHKHQAVKCLNLLDPALESIPKGWYPAFHAPKMDLDLPHPILFVSVTNNRIGSTLDLEKYERVLKGSPWSVVINCESKDRETAELLSRTLFRPNRVIATEKLKDFLSLLASVDAAFIGDGGIMHLAAALGKPQLVLFGGTKVWEWAPLSDKAICLADPDNVNFISEEKIRDELRKLS